jgi:hypothetical protein
LPKGRIKGWASFGVEKRWKLKRWLIEYLVDIVEGLNESLGLKSNEHCQEI